MIGRTLSHYEILDCLGIGGMGEVYRARDTKLGREVALKVLPPEAAARADLRERFNQEAQTIASLNHPNIVTIHSIESEGDVHFLTMEIVRGHTLSEVLKDGPLELDEFFSIARPLAGALESAHGRGITHRDLKPDNVMVTGDGQVKLLDFGIAKLTAGEMDPEGARTVTGLTGEGQIVGTVPYMSPEQVRGEPVDARSDIFSLGIIFYEMLGGRNPFAGTTMADVASAILRDTPGPIPGLDEELYRLVLRCLEKDPEARWPTVAALGERLAGILGAPAHPAPLAPSGSTDAIATLIEKGRWNEAFDALTAAAADRELSGQENAYLADAAEWLSRLDVWTQAMEAAYAGFIKEDRPEQAARTAVRLGEYHAMMHATAVGNGWLRKAERILAGIPESLTHGHLARVKAKIACDIERDPEGAEVWAQKTMEIARRFGDRDLECLALQDQGRIQVGLGNVTAGMALLDEAMAAAIGGEVAPLTVGITYCNMISTCKAMADYRRAMEWSMAGEQWCQGYSDSTFPGICQVNRAEIMRLRGAWEDAETQILSTCRAIGDSHFVSGHAFYELGEIRLRRGEYAEAEAAFQKAHRLGRDPVPGMAILRYVQGKHRAAWKMLDRTLKHDVSHPLDRTNILPHMVEIGLAAGETDAAREAAEELEAIAKRYPSPVFEAGAALARGALALSQGDVDAATGILRSAIKLYKECELPYEEAKARALLGQAYGKDGSLEDADLEWDAAAAAFTALGAAPDLAVLQTLRDRAD